MELENTLLGKLLSQKQSPSLENGELIEGKVISIQGTEVFVDLHPYGTGIIYGKE